MYLKILRVFIKILLYVMDMTTYYMNNLTLFEMNMCYSPSQRMKEYMAMPSTTDTEGGERLDQSDIFESQSQSLISGKRVKPRKQSARVKNPLDVEKKTSKTGQNRKTSRGRGKTYQGAC